MEFSPCLDGVQLELLKEDRLKDDGLNFELEIKAVKSESDKPGPYVITYHWEAIPQQTPEFLIDFGDAPTINYKATHLLEATHLYSSPEKFLKSKITFKLLLLPSSSVAKPLIPESSAMQSGAHEGLPFGMRLFTIESPHPLVQQIREHLKG